MMVLKSIFSSQLQIWKKYIFWERNNPLWIDDTLLLTRRVMYAYEQCLQCMGFNPDIWCEAASYLETTSKQLAEKGVGSHSLLDTLGDFSTVVCCIIDNAYF